MAKSNHSTALPIDAPVTALRTSFGMTGLPNVSVPLSISLTGSAGHLPEKIVAMSFARCRCLQIGPIRRRYCDGLTADRDTAGVGRRTPGIAGEREGANPHPRCAGRTAPQDAENGSRE